jgi:hypothetical protein
MLLSAVLAAEMALVLISSFSRMSTRRASDPGTFSSWIDICLMVMEDGLSFAYSI